MAQPLEIKIAIVTGGGSGIGAALAREFAARGARVIVADAAGDDASRVADEIGGPRPRRRRLGPPTRSSEWLTSPLRNAAACT